MPPPKQATRLDTVDALRGLSILGVLIFHLDISLRYSAVSQFLPLPTWLIARYTDIGFNGVPCFFAISGFLITLTAIRRFGSLAELSVASFYRIRFARIAPLLLLLLAVLSVLHLLRLPSFHIRPLVASLPRALLSALTFHFNWLSAHRSWFPRTWDVLWTLSIEEMFYLFFPLACALFLRRRAGVGIFLALLGCLVLAGPLTRHHLLHLDPAWSLRSYFSNMDNVALGCLFAMLAVRLEEGFGGVRSRYVYAMQFAGAVCMGFAAWPDVIPVQWLNRLQTLMADTDTSFTLLGFGTCLIMLGCVLRPSRGSVLTLPLRWFGRYSYEVYLSHEFVLAGLMLLLSKTRRPADLLVAGATLALAGLLGWLISRFFSEPVNRLLRGAPLPSQLK